METSPISGRSSALIESRRCLGCYEAPCAKACPAHVDIPAFIKRLSEDNIIGAGEIVYQSCPLSATCGIACPTSVLCEGACTLNLMDQTPIRIGALQSYVASNYNVPEICIDHNSKSKIAIIGGGPSGLGCAVELNRRMYNIDLYERSDRLGGLMGRVIPSYRLPKNTINIDLDRIRHSGINFYLNMEINSNNVQNIVQEHDAVFIGVGLNNLQSINIPGHQYSGVISALDLLASARDYFHGQAQIPHLGNRVLIIGGGNVALDAAVVSKKLGAEQVIIIYRRTKKEMPGWETEYLEACALGVEFRWLSTIEQIMGNEDKIHAVKIQEMQLKAKGLDGRRCIEPIVGNTYQLMCDNVVLALGQSFDNTLSSSLGIDLSYQGTLKINPQSYQTTNPKIFAAGESVNGGSTIVMCMSQGMLSGRSIDKWLGEQQGAQK